MHRAKRFKDKTNPALYLKGRQIGKANSIFPIGFDISVTYNKLLLHRLCWAGIMDCAAKFPPSLPEIEMSYKHRVENKVQ